MSELMSSASGEPRREGVRQEVQLACFLIGGEMYALDILRIKEVIRPLKVTVVPNAPSFVEGVINLRGAVIPVVDLRKRFGVSQIQTGQKTRIIICVVSSKVLGLVVDEVIEVRRYTRAEVQPAPNLAKGRDSEFFVGVCRRGDDLVMVLDLEKILNSAEKNELGKLTSLR